MGTARGSITLALAGDTMLGRNVAVAMEEREPTQLVAPEVAGLMRAADLTILNLECCISARGERWPAPGTPFFFRAPPRAVELLTHLGVDAVTLANNHALDYGVEALLDTLEHLADAGIAVVGAGRDLAAARRPAVLETGGLRLRVVGVTDHPDDFAATRHRPGVALARLGPEVPDWLRTLVGEPGADVTVVTPHWGPNMTARPLRHIAQAADALLAAGATLVAGHSAHVFHGARLVADPPRALLYDLGDFLDDYAVDPLLRNDLGLLWLVELGRTGVSQVAGVPLRLRTAWTAPAVGADRDWVVRRLRDACAPFGTTVVDAGDRLVVTRR